MYCFTGGRRLFQILWASHNILTLTNLKALPEISMEWVPATTAKGILDFKAWFCDLNSSSSSESQSGNWRENKIRYFQVLFLLNKTVEGIGTIKWPRPTKAVFYRSARIEQNKSIKVLFPKPKPNRTEHVKST